MPLDITCNHCGKSFRIADDVAGKHFRCVACRGILKAPERAAAAPPPQRPPPKKIGAELPPPREERPNTSPPTRAKTPKRRRSLPEPEVDDYDQDPYGYEGAGPSWQDMPGGPVGQPKRKPKPKQKTFPSNLRATNPHAFEAYDKIINEIAIFWIGIGVIVGLLSVAIHVISSDGPLDFESLPNILIGALTIAGTSILVGLITFTKSRIWLISLFFICAIYLLASIILAVMLGCLMWILPASFCLMYVRIGQALSAYPQPRISG